MATIVSSQDGLASATTTWVGGVVPVEDDQVTINHEVTIDGTYSWGDDTSTGVDISSTGTLKASRTVNSTLTVKGQLSASGSIDYGADGDIIPASVTAIINLNNSDTPAAGRWGLTTLGDTNISFQGAEKTTNTKLSSSATAGTTTLEVEDAAGWQVGDRLTLMSPTPDKDNQDRVTVSAVSGNTITISALPQTHPSGQYLSNMTKNVKVRATDSALPTFANFNIHTLSVDNKRIINTEFTDMCHSTGSSTRAGVNFSAFNSLTQNAIDEIRDCTFTCTSTGVGLDFFATSSRVVVSNLAFDLSTTSTAIAIRQGATCTVNNSNVYRSSLAVSSGFSQGAVNPVFTGCVFSGSTQCMLVATGNSFLVENCEFRSSDNGFTLGFGSSHIIRNCRFSPAGVELVRNFLVNNSAVSEVLCVDCTFGAATTFVSNIGNASDTAAVFISNRDNNPLNQEVYRRAGTLFRDNTTFRTASPAARVDLENDSAPFTFPLDIFAPTGSPVVVSGYIRKSAGYGSTNLPSVTLSGLGITPSTFTISDVDDVFQQFTVSGTQTTGTDGVLTLTFNFQSDDGSVWVDDVVAPVARPVNVGDFSFWQNGLPLQAVLSNFVSSQEVWNAQTSEFTLPGSVGMEWSALRSLINDRVDEVISSRASSVEVAAVTTSLTAAIDALNNLSVNDVVTGVEGSSVIAKETTVASRASQTSVDSLSTTVGALPTSAFNSSDRTVLEALSNTSEGDIHTALDSYTNKDDYQADVSGLLSSTDTRLNSLTNLDASVSSRSSFDAATDTVEARNMRGTDNALLAADYVVPTNPDLSTLTQDVTDIKNGLLGRWEIVGTQLIMYEADGTTVLRTFNLFDEAGQPTNTNILRREPV